MGYKHIAIVAGLRITHELLTMRPFKSFDMNKFKRRIKPLENKLDVILPNKEKINKEIKLI